MELRKDYILDRWVIVSEDRGKRPMDYVENKEVKNKECIFCAGNEIKTPPTIYDVKINGEWKVRVIPNKFSAVDPNGNPNVETHNRFYTFAGDHGRHEVVIEVPKHNKNFGDIEIEDLCEVIRTYNIRIKELLKDEKVKYVCLFKNQGKAPQ